jgi:hypothetical protein
LFVNAAELAEIAGQPLPVRGKIELTFLTSETLMEIPSGQDPESIYVPNAGRFVVVYYSVRNESDGQIQPMGQINAALTIVNSSGREWVVADASPQLFAVSAAAAESKGYVRPDADLAAGADYYTAAVFDVPADATGLSLVWPQFQARVWLQ